MMYVNRGTTEKTRRGMSYGSVGAFFALAFGLTCRGNALGTG